MVETFLPYNFEPRSYQLPFLKAMDSGYRFACLKWARRHGKDKTAFCYLIRRMFDEVGNYAYIFPTASLARKAAWQNIDANGFKLLDHIPKELVKRKLDQQMFIELTNGSTLTFFGSDKQISVGTNFKGIVFSEFALQNPEAYYYLRPVILENNGFIILASTPRGKNAFYDLWQMAKNNPNWFAQEVTWKDGGIFTEEDIEEERKNGMSEEMINSEYNTEFSGLEGSYYIRSLDKMRLNGQIGNVPFDPSARVNTAWDLGYRDSTAICFFQICGNELHFIDYLEAEGEALTYYINRVEQKARENNWILGNHYAPHDISVHELSSGISRKALAASLGINFTIVPSLKQKVIEGIEMVRGLFPRIWIDENKCERMIKALENYRKDYDEKRQIFSDRPVHDWSEHGSSAFRYACMGVKFFGSGSSSMSTEQLYELNARSRRL
ncbi:MAG: hypothetical protein KKH61_21645 [Gammaproteobacteria bacterium]|nr:hypothetical protein [Gammaproteobacteria bacterium]